MFESAPGKRRPTTPKEVARPTGIGDWHAQDWQTPPRPSRWPGAIAWLAALTLTIWGLGATAYLLMHEEQVAEGVEQRTAMQSVYEDRIGRLRSEVDAINSRLMLEQDAFDAKLETLRRRQAMLERRQTELTELIKEAHHPAFRTIAELIEDGAQAMGSLPAASETGETAPTREIRLAFAPRGRAAGGTQPRNAAEHALLRLAQSQERLEAQQQLVLDALETGTSGAAQTIQQVVADLRLDTMEFATQPINSAPGVTADASLGGPFVPMPLGGHESKSLFERQISRVRAGISRSIATYESLIGLPLRRPLAEQIDITSGFGPRRDPFVESMALHDGIDFRAGRGTEVHATAAGLVTWSGRNAGYGKMVEIEHAGGVVTRYAHLSALSVGAGERVTAGQVIGRVGSTGRSTGPHLHYEMHIDGEPIDPSRFLDAGARLIATLDAD